MRIVLFTWLFLLLSGCVSAERSSETPSSLLAEISATKEQLLIKNGDAFVWSQVTITINGDYTYTTATVPRGGSSFPLASFRNASGASYEPSLLHVRSVVIHAADIGGGMSGEFRW